jgi:hypothetical protein
MTTETVEATPTWTSTTAPVRRAEKFTAKLAGLQATVEQNSGGYVSGQVDGYVAGVRVIALADVDYASRSVETCKRWAEEAAPKLAALGWTAEKGGAA